MTAKDLAVFTRQFSVMIDAGLPLVQCLEILAGQQENKTFQTVLVSTRASVEGGATLSAAMRKHEEVFDALPSAWWGRDSRTGGILDAILQRLATYIEKNVKLKRAVKSALVYPVAVLLVAGGVITLLLWNVVPILATLFLGLGVDLPLPTRIVIALSNFIGSIFGLLIVVALGAAVFGLKVWYGTTNGRYALDSILLKLPLIGILLRKIAVARFTRTLGTLISSGVPILEGLDITGRTAGNAVVEKSLKYVNTSVRLERIWPTIERNQRVPRDGHANDWGRGTNRGDGRHAAEDCRFLRGRSGCRGEGPAFCPGAGDDRFPDVVVGGIVISMYLPAAALIGKLSSSVNRRRVAHRRQISRQFCLSGIRLGRSCSEFCPKRK